MNSTRTSSPARTPRARVRPGRHRLPVPRVLPLPDGSVSVEGGLRISARQCQVLELLAAGLSNEAIAAELGISSQTVKHHISRLLELLGMANRVGLAAWWAEADARLNALGAPGLCDPRPEEFARRRDVI